MYFTLSVQSAKIFKHESIIDGILITMAIYKFKGEIFL